MTRLKLPLHSMLRGTLTRLRELDRVKADAMLAAAFGIAGLIESLFLKSGGHSRLVTAIAAVLVVVPLAWRRRNTLAAVVGYSALMGLAVPFNTFLFANVTAPFVAMMVLGYTSGRYELGWRMWLELALLAVTVELASLASRTATPLDLLWIALFLGGPALAGRAIRSRILYQREMRDKAARLEAERELAGQRAVDEERARIASELQAVVANGVSAMVVQAEAVPRLFESDDRAAASQALAVIEETGRDALAEMRRLLGVLRRDDEGPALAPQPTLARADSLIGQVKSHGMKAAITVRGEPATLSPGVDLAAYRVLQEALLSAARTGGVSRADVSVVYGDDNVLLKVRDDREDADATDQEMLRALRERVGLYGGIVRTTPREGTRGFELEARLPIGGSR